MVPAAARRSSPCRLARTLALLLAPLLIALPAAAQDVVRFAAIGDYGINQGTVDVANFIHAQDPDLMLSLGDQCYGSSPLITRQVGDHYGDYVAQGRFWPVLGNHEFTDLCAGPKSARASLYYDYFDLPGNERYYDFVVGPVHFFAVNSATEPDGIQSTSRQARWLEAGLAASTSPWKVVFFHHPAYSSGTTSPLAKMRWPFDRWGADAVISGHSHIYERFTKDEDGDGVELPYFISGLGGKSKGGLAATQPDSDVRYNSDYGALFATASATSLRFEFRTITNKLIDSYEITQPGTDPEPPPPPPDPDPDPDPPPPPPPDPDPDPDPPPPDPDPSGTVRFAAFGDYGPGSGTTQVADLVQAEAADFIVSLGNQCAGNAPSIAEQVGIPYGDYVAARKLWPVLGNRELTNWCAGTSEDRASDYYAYFELPGNERYYDYVVGPVHFFAMNSTTEPDGIQSNSRQADWLRERLAASTAAWKIVYFHHAPYTSSATAPQTKMRWAFEDWGVDAVLSAHSQIYERIAKDDNGDGVWMPYFTSGLGGRSKDAMSTIDPDSQLRYNADFGALFVTASETGLAFEFRTVTGEVIDQFALSR